MNGIKTENINQALNPKFEMSKKEKKTLEDLIEETWNAISILADLTSHGNQPDEYVLSNSDHIVTKTIIYIYSMESFVYKKVNESSRNQDKTKISTLGPFAVLLT